MTWNPNKETTMKGLALAVAVAAALFAAGTAQAITYPGAVPAPQLEAKLPTAMKVFCTANTNESFAMLADRELYLDAPTCATLLGKPSNLSFARAAHTLYHEWWHVAFQEVDEDRTEEGAYAVYRYMLRHFWRMTAKAAQQAYDETTKWSPYHPVIAASAADPLLAGEGF